VGFDGYSPGGLTDWDGLTNVAEDGDWLLLKSNYTLKPIRIVSLLVSADDYLIITFADAETLSSGKSWSATTVSFAHPQDFVFAETQPVAPRVLDGKEIGGPFLTSGIVAGSRRAMMRVLNPEGDIYSADDELKISVVGFALDANLGLMPTFFTLARSTASRDDLCDRLAAHGADTREYALVGDNPLVSLHELFHRPRYGDAELLLAAVYFSAEWFAEIWNRTGAPARLSMIGTDEEELLCILQRPSEAIANGISATSISPVDSPGRRAAVL